MSTRILASILSAFVLLPAWTGCGGPPRPADLPPLYATTITISQEDAPLEGALVSLFSEDTTFKWGVAGITDSSGKAEIKTHGRFSGAPLGPYKVVVTKTEPEDLPEITEFRPDNEEGEKTPVRRRKTIKLYTLLEKKYTNIVDTPLTITIEKGRNGQTFDVGKPVREVGELFEL